MKHKRDEPNPKSHLSSYEGADLTQKNDIKVCSPKTLTKNHLLPIKKSSSIQSIHYERKGKNIIITQFCPLKVIKNHLNLSMNKSQYHDSAQKLKRNAYYFFDQQKVKRFQVQKKAEYLLPKICMKSKRAYRTNFQQNSQQQNQISPNKNAGGGPKKERQRKMQAVKLSQMSLLQNIPSQIQEIKENFRLKCESQLQKITFQIPYYPKKDKCFFDLALSEINQLYSKDPQILKPQNVGAESENFKESDGHKFKLISFKSEQILAEEDQSVPLFLMERLSLKGPLNLQKDSFLTQAPKIKFSHTKNCYIDQKSMLGSSTTNLR